MGGGHSLVLEKQDYKKKPSHFITLIVHVPSVSEILISEEKVCIWIEDLMYGT